MIDLGYTHDIIESLNQIMGADEVFTTLSLSEQQEAIIVDLLARRYDNPNLQGTAELVLMEMLHHRPAGINTTDLVTQIRDVLNRYSS
jgi:hypothetical protein